MTSLSAPAVRLGVLLSGRGSNFQAIARAIAEGQIPHAEIVLVLSNRPESLGLLDAQHQGLPTQVFSPGDFAHRAAFDAAMVAGLKAAQVDWVILAGYDRILSPTFIEAFPGRILNIHPSLLPAYGGKGMVGQKVHQTVIEAGEMRSGCTVHVVTPEVDAGPILGQREVFLASDETPETLAQKVLAEEHRLYPEVVAKVVTELWRQRQAQEVLKD